MMLEGRLEAWLRRTNRSRGLVQADGLPIALGTDVGLIRKENQDVVAAARITSDNLSFGSTVVVLVADGMGGMRDGRSCACIAAASFFASFSHRDNLDLEILMQRALRKANQAVYGSFRGQGGSTIAAIAVGQDGIIVSGYVGDSRIYALGSAGGNRVVRLSVDDSLEEAVGGSGRELLQFIGMGDGLVPHTSTVSSDISAFVLTTDGVHFVQASVFEQVLEKAPSARSAIERALALARWCGGPDNASAVSLEIKELIWPGTLEAAPRVQVWDPFGQLEIMFVSQYGSSAPLQDATVARPPIKDDQVTEIEKPQEAFDNREHSVRSSATKVDQRKKRGKPRSRPLDDAPPQLEIEVDQEGDA